MSLPRQSAVFDDRRNSSRVRLPAFDALPNALEACRALRRSQPALVRWIEDGAPTLTEAEHLERFGEPYRPSSRRR